MPCCCHLHGVKYFNLDLVWLLFEDVLPQSFLKPFQDSVGAVYLAPATTHGFLMILYVVTLVVLLLSPIGHVSLIISPPLVSLLLSSSSPLSPPPPPAPSYTAAILVTSHHHHHHHDTFLHPVLSRHTGVIGWGGGCFEVKCLGRSPEIQSPHSSFRLLACVVDILRRFCFELDSRSWQALKRVQTWSKSWSRPGVGEHEPSWTLHKSKHANFNVLGFKAFQYRGSGLIVGQFCKSCRQHECKISQAPLCPCIPQEAPGKTCL